MKGGGNKRRRKYGIRGRGASSAKGTEHLQPADGASSNSSNKIACYINTVMRDVSVVSAETGIYPESANWHFLEDYVSAEW